MEKINDDFEYLSIFKQNNNFLQTFVQIKKFDNLKCKRL